MENTSVVVMPMSNGRVPLILLLITLMASAVSFLPVQEARASIELKYDDGVPEGSDAGVSGEYRAVKFSLPPGWSRALLSAVRYYFEADSSWFRVHVLGSDGSTALLSPPLIQESTVGWLDVDLRSYGIIVTGDFYVAIEFSGVPGPGIGYDTTSPLGPSFTGSPGNWEVFDLGRNIMIRAVIDPAPAPVGGIITPTNKLQVLAPYLALAGLVAAVSAVVVVGIGSKD
ncbi:hypothetical protein KEJ39_03965 [Candidatus Bathyarchaeota archaeon]|nr:hypothetical protein [Candidatus Bathyarchaeota archaeon]